MPTVRGACASGRRHRRRRATGDRPRTTAGPDRGVPPVGDPAPADLRGRPPRVSHLPRRHAHRRVHHAVVGDRPDPHPPPHPRLPCGARDPRRREEPPIDAGPREPRGVAVATSVGRRSACHLSTARRATTRGASVWAAVPPARRMGPRRHRSPHGARRSHGPRGARTRQRARRRPSVGARPAGDRALYSTDSRPAPIEIPIP